MEDFKKELTVKFPVKIISSLTIVVQFCLNSGSGMVKFIFLERALRQNANLNPSSGEK